MLPFLLACTAAKETGVAGEDTGSPPTDTSPHETATDSVPIPIDGDGDGATEDMDCDDADASVHPGATELCNAIDDDCDGTVDEGSAWLDADADGYGSATAVEGSVCPTTGTATRSDDCDDSDAEVHPDAVEQCDGNRDEDCDGDAGCDLEDEAAWWYSGEWAHYDGASADYGDLDGDGLDDVLLGGGGGEYEDDAEDTREGQVHIVLSGPALAGTEVDLAAAEWTLFGDAGDYAAGYYVGSARFIPDLDGDGTLEVLVGATGRSGAWLVSGAALLNEQGEFALPDLAAREYSDAAYTVAGSTVSTAGDADGDGVRDLAVGCEECLWVVSGADEGPAVLLDDGVRINGGFGTSIARAFEDVGDVDGDGLDDLLVGDNSNEEYGEDSGQVFLFLGGFATWGTVIQVTDADVRIHTDDAMGVGSHVARVDDLDGDGLGDWLTSEYDEAGAIFVVTETAALVGRASSTDELSSRIVGQQVTSIAAGDFDGDGGADIVTDGGDYDPEHAVHVILHDDIPNGGLLDLDDDPDILTFTPDDDLYGLVLLDGDATGDGLDDLLLTDFSFSNTGAAWLVAGR